MVGITRASSTPRSLLSIHLPIEPSVGAVRLSFCQRFCPVSLSLSIRLPHCLAENDLHSTAQ